MNKFKQATSAVCLFVFLVVLLPPATFFHAGAQSNSTLQLIRESNEQVLELRSALEQAKTLDEQAEIRERATTTIHQRFLALQDLVRQAPEAALEQAFPEAVLSDLREAFPACASELESHGDWFGSIEILAEDEEQPANARRWLSSLAERLELHFAMREPALKAGKVMTVAGVKFGTVVAISSILPKAASPFVPGRILVQFRPGISANVARRVTSAFGARAVGEIPQIGVHLVELPAAENEEEFALAFKARPEVAAVELDRLLRPEELTPNDPVYQSEWHLPKIAGPTAWSTTTGSSNVTIAILDTGVDGTHPDLSSKLVPGWNFYDNNADTSDVFGHGTAVAGSAAAASNNSTGVASVAWNCLLMPIRISDSNGYGSISAIANGLIWAADHGARVANISYRVSNISIVNSAARYFKSKGGVVTVAAGNQSAFDSAYENPDVITVSATISNDTLAPWSNTGYNIDLAGPGSNIYTTNRGGGYSAWSGTSFSAPIVAAVAALVISVNPDLTAAQIQDILRQSADDLGAVGWDAQYGWGRVNAAKAVALATGNPTPTPTPTPTPEPTPAPTPTPTPILSDPDTTPPTIRITTPLGGVVSGANVFVYVSTKDDSGVTKVELYVDGALKATSTSSPYTTKWSLRQVMSGAHTLQCKAYDAAGNVGVSDVVTVYR